MSNVSKKMSDFRNCEKSCFSTFPNRLFWSIKILIFCTSLIWEMAVVESQILDAETVTIKQGVVKGSTKVLNGQRLSTFLGIPYAEPPVGNRRLRPTSPHPGWKGRKGSFFSTKMTKLCIGNIIPAPRTVILIPFNTRLILYMLLLCHDNTRQS
jgi:Carboxylesterase family